MRQVPTVKAIRHVSSTYKSSIMLNYNILPGAMYPYEPTITDMHSDVPESCRNLASPKSATWTDNCRHAFFLYQIIHKGNL